MSSVHRGVYAWRDASAEPGRSLCKPGDVESQKDRRQGMDKFKSENQLLYLLVIGG